MRHITFGPTETNYFDLDEDEDSTPQENYSERLNQRFSGQRQTGSLSGASSPRMVRPHRGSNFSSAFNLSQGRSSENKNTEVIFFAGEDLYRDNIVGTRELAIKKYCKCKL